MSRQPLSHSILQRYAENRRPKIPYPNNYQTWLRELFPDSFSIDFAEHHREFWDWASAVGYESPDPFIAVWPRGGGKSTNTEMLPIYLWKKDVRNYCWYVSDTQAMADDHIGSIASILESLGVNRKVNRYGSSRGWRRNRLWTEDGLIVDAIGLDTGKRGVRIEEKRPDLIILDDVDSELDTIETTQKKESILQQKILPAGSRNVAVVFVQNMVIPHGVMSRLVNDESDWLQRKVISGPFPAVEDLVTEKRDGRDVIVSGDPIWEGQDLDDCQSFIDLWGLRAFNREAQHEVFDTQEQIFLPSWWNGKNRFDTISSVGRYLFVDTAFKDKKTNDPSAFLVADLTKGYKVAVQYVEQERIQSAGLPEKIETIADRFKVTHGIIIEDKGSGTTTIQTLRNLSGYSDIIFSFMPKGSKEYRARNSSIWCGRDCVLLKRDLNPDFSGSDGQLFRFPNAPHDDMVDTFTMAILYLENFIDKGFKSRIKTERPVQSRIHKAMKNYDN